MSAAGRGAPEREVLLKGFPEHSRGDRGFGARGKDRGTLRGGEGGPWDRIAAGEKSKEWKRDVRGGKLPTGKGWGDSERV